MAREEKNKDSMKFCKTILNQLLMLFNYQKSMILARGCIESYSSYVTERPATVERGGSAILMKDTQINY